MLITAYACALLHVNTLWFHETKASSGSLELSKKRVPAYRLVSPRDLINVHIQIIHIFCACGFETQDKTQETSHKIQLQIYSKTCWSGNVGCEDAVTFVYTLAVIITPMQISYQCNYSMVLWLRHGSSVTAEALGTNYGKGYQKPVIHGQLVSMFNCYQRCATYHEQMTRSLSFFYWVDRNRLMMFLM